MEKTVSIIVPVYNVEKYLERCVRSLIGQTYRDVEIILVDDKSPDSSGKLCDELAEKYGNIRVIHKEVNQGLGFARNTGLEYVTGDYILFVDSDDYVDEDLCRKAVTRLEESGADICYFGHKKDYGDHITESDLSFLKEEYTGDPIISDFLSNTLAQSENESGAPRIGMSAWRIMYRADVIRKNGLKFCSEREYLNEDLFFRIRLVQCIKKVTVIHENLYYYCYNGASLTTSYRKDRFEASKRMYEKLFEETEVFETEEIARRCQRAFLNNLMVCIRQEVKYRKDPGVSADERLREICSDEIVKKVLSSYPVRKLPIQPRMFYLAVKAGRIGVLKILVLLKG